MQGMGLVQLPKLSTGNHLRQLETLARTRALRDVTELAPRCEVGLMSHRRAALPF